MAALPSFKTVLTQASFFAQATYFNQKFHATFFLAAEEASGGSGGGTSRATQAAALLRRLGPPRAPLAPLPLDANQGSHNPGTGQEGERGRVQPGPVPHPRTGLPAAAVQCSGDVGSMQSAGFSPNGGAVLLRGGSAADGRHGGDMAPATASEPPDGFSAGPPAAGGGGGGEGLSGERGFGSSLHTMHAAPSGTSHAGHGAAPEPGHLPQPESGSGGAWSHDRGDAHADAPTPGAPAGECLAVGDAAAAHRRLRETVHRQAAVMRCAFIMILVHGSAACSEQALGGSKGHSLRSKAPLFSAFLGEKDTPVHLG